MTRAHPIAVRSAPRFAAVAGLALLAAWTLYAVPPARARAVAALRPWLGAVLPAEAALKFGEVRARRGAIDGQTVLYVEGSLVNASGRAMKAPTLRLALIGDDGVTLYSWKAKPAAPQLAAGGATPFQTRLLAPPESFRNIAVTVAQDK